jgi:hypothetical protein
MTIHDYLLNHDGVDWRTMLAGWGKLLPRSFSVWLVNRFGDLFIVAADGQIHLLETGTGMLKQIAVSQDDFCQKIDLADNAGDWLMIPLVDKLVAAGKKLSAGQCYSFQQPPALGGAYTVENTRVVRLAQHFARYAAIHSGREAE